MRLAFPRFTLLCLIFFASACATASWVILQSLERKHRKHQVQQANEQAISQRQRMTLQRLSEQKDREFLASHIATGRLAKADPHAWRQTLEKMLRELPIGTLNYEFGPTMPLTATGTSLTQRLLKISAPVLHEEILLAFLERITTASPAWVRLRRCQLRTGDAADPILPLLAECEFDWTSR